MRTLLIPLALVLSAASAGAQTLNANFDVQSEGWNAPVYTEGPITLQNLDGAFPGQTVYHFTIERADGDLGALPGFTPLNAMGFFGYSPGPGTAFTRCKSFDIVWTGGLASEAQIEVYELGNDASNSISLVALLGGNVVANTTLQWPGGFQVRHHTLHVGGVSFDSLRVIGSGPNDSGVFFAVVDTLRIELSIGTLFCAGDGSGTACPCGNASAPGDNVGCLHSLGSGGKLRATGIASIGADTVLLSGSQMPNSSALYFQGLNQQGGGAGNVFGDGLRCAGGTILRLGTKLNAGGSSQYPDVGDPPVSVRGGVTSPGTRTYQVWYRNAASFCTPATFNLTNGLELTWI